MYQENKDLIIAAFAVVAVVALIYVGSYFVIKARCYAKYEPSYAPVSFGMLQGCMATFNGKRIPVERIREGE